MLLAFPVSSYASGTQLTDIYTYKSKTGVMSFSDRPPVGLPYSRYRADCFACKVDSFIDWRKAKLYIAAYKEDINQAATQYGIDPAYVRAVIHAESHFNHKAISKQGAQGLMQLMPETAKELGVTDALNAQQNIKGGVKHLSRLLKKYKGNNTLASAAYNAGEGAVKKHGGIPPYQETQVYVKRVNILYHRYAQIN